MSGKSKTRLVALIVTCFIATPAATQAQASTKASAKVPTNLRSSVLKFGVQCRDIAKLGVDCGAGPAAIKYFDRHPGHQPNHYSKLRKLYFSSAAVCNKLRPSKKDGALVGTGITRYSSYTDFECVWGLPAPPGPGLRIVIKLPNAGHRWHYNDCNYYIGYGYDVCNTLSGGVQANQNYWAGQGELVFDAKKGFVRIVRFARDEAPYYAHLADDNIMFFKIGLALGLPTASAD